MKYLKPLIGSLLIIMAIVGLFYWELSGREAVLTDPVLVAKEVIKEGTIITEDHVSVIKIEQDERIDEALNPDRLPEILGKTAKTTVLKNGQISAIYFFEENLKLDKGQSIFVIPADWIAMRSSTIRRGDWVRIYDNLTLDLIGRYQIAFVKDENEVEVKNTDARERGPLLERIDATAVVDHVEIISDLDGYRRIAEKMEKEGQKGLLIVQQEDKE